MNLSRHLFPRLFKWIQTHLEPLFWVTALTVLFFLPENKSETSLCLFSLFGFGYCPGCGMGHAIHYALHLKIAASFQHHPLGIFGLMIIFIRIKQLLSPVKPYYATKPH
ncbi:MAG: DUF2752 domain-containing protein [Chitinophagaceae bacterium]|nr:DUF2752 domain-containing protein [Chitinophagaceae bacterium]